MFETEVSVSLRFRHRLEGFSREFAEEHEHVWRVTVNLSTQALDQRGVSVDFTKLKENLAALLKPYQNKFLNDCEPFDELPPTAEHIARWVAEALSESYPGLVRSVAVGTDEERARFVLPHVSPS